MKRDEKILFRVYQKTFCSTHPTFPMAACLAKGNRIISFGTNKYNRTHPKQAKRINSLGQEYGRNHPHAELDCLIKAPYEIIAGGTLYIVRRLISGGVGTAMPCINCQSLIQEYKIRKVVYSLPSKELADSWYESYIT